MKPTPQQRLYPPPAEKEVVFDLKIAEEDFQALRTESDRRGLEPEELANQLLREQTARLRAVLAAAPAPAAETAPTATAAPPLSAPPAPRSVCETLNCREWICLILFLTILPIIFLIMIFGIGF